MGNLGVSVQLQLASSRPRENLKEKESWNLVPRCRGGELYSKSQGGILEVLSTSNKCKASLQHGDGEKRENYDRALNAAQLILWRLSLLSLA